MEMKIGSNLAALRKSQGMTQEQLAEKLGISAPAISKWETDTSYPDITLLCPLARALNTNIDTLLQFEETLSDQEVSDKINAVIKTAFNEGFEEGEKMMMELVHIYPNCIALKFNAAVVWDSFQMFFPSVDESIRNRWKTRKKELLLEIRATGNSVYSQAATLQLAGIAIAEHHLDEAELLLRELPEHLVDPTLSWANLYLKKDEPEEALKVTQKRLYSLICQVESCLALMMNPKMIPDLEQILQICNVYRTVEQLFSCSGGMYDGMYLNIYLQMGKIPEAAACLSRYIDVLTGPIILPKQFLFSPGLELKEQHNTSTKELCQILLKSLEKEEHYPELLQYPEVQSALEKLKATIK